MKFSIKERPRRLRQSEAIRNLVTESFISPGHLVYPLFIQDSKSAKESIAALPGIYRFNSDSVLKEVEESLKFGVTAFALFPKVNDDLKDKKSSYSLKSENFYLKCIEKIKTNFPEVCLISDVACDPYSSDGHDGIVDSVTGKILNDESLLVLQEMALKQAQAGVDIVAPSDMMDGRVRAIREHLDQAKFFDVAILSYCVKYASNFYGPFRSALDSAPKSGDKKTYQMDYRNVRDLKREARLDIMEGADILMVKPGLPYLDMVYRLSRMSELPVAVYQVSGEYAMLKGLSISGQAKEPQLVMETLYAFKRAGAQMIFTYYAKEAAKWIQSGYN